MGHFGLSIYHHCTKLIGAIIMSEDEITAQNRNPRWRPSAIIDSRKPDFWSMGPLGLAIVHQGTKFGAKNVDRRRNYMPQSKSKMAAVRHLGFSKIRFLSSVTIGLPIVYHCTKFGAKMFIDAKIMAQNRNPRWRLSAILDFRKSDFWALGPLGLPIFLSLYQIWRKNVDRRRNYDPESKSKMAAVRHLGFSKIWFLSTGNPLGCRFSILV